MAKLEKDLQDIQTQLQSGRLNQTGEQELTAQGQRKQRELTRIQQDLQADVESERNDILQRAGTRMQDVVKKVAEEKGLDVVLDSAGTHYFKAALDITERHCRGVQQSLSGKMMVGQCPATWKPTAPRKNSVLAESV